MAEINLDTLREFEKKILEITIDNLEVITGHSFAVELTDIVSYADAEKTALNESLEVKVGFTPEKYGEWRFYLPPDLGGLLATSMVGEDPAPFNEEAHLEPLQELMAQLLSPYLSELTSIETAQVETSNLEIEQVSGAPELNDQNILMSVTCTVDEEQEFPFFKVVPTSLIANLSNTSSQPEAKPEVVPDEEIIDVNGAEFQPLQGQSQNGNSANLDMLMDLEMPINIELGRTRLTIKSILQLGQGSIIELDKLSGDPVDVYINDRKFAEGEVVVVDENFGVRVTEIISPVEKIKALQ